MKHTVVLALLSICLMVSSPLLADDNSDNNSNTVNLDAIVVTGEKITTPTKQTNETVYTGSEITKKGMEIQGNKGETSVYQIMDILPGVNVETPDPYGLAAEQRNVRVRGVRGYLGSMTVEGVPNWGGNPMGPREYIYDTENFDGIYVYKGVVPGDFGTGVGGRGGAIELSPEWPDKDKFGAEISQSIGTDSYNRTFLKIDSGKIPEIDTGVSLSYSYTDADKWKGPGDLGPRNNFNMMVSQPVGDKKESIKLWVNYNDLSQNLYRPLTYSETLDLSANYNKDYNSTLTGIKSQDINYYDYNRGDYRNVDVMSVIPFAFSDSVMLSIKPYYSMEDTEILGGATSQGGVIQKRTRDTERYGVITQLDGDIFSSDAASMMASVGYTYESNDMKIRTQNYDPTTFSYKGYGVYTESDGDGIVSSPFLKLAGTLGDFDWQTGVKYFSYDDPATFGYLSPAPSYDLVRAEDLDRSSKKYEEVLPTLGLGYNFDESLSIYTSYGKNFIRPYSYVPIINIYNANRSTFQDQGITLNDLFNGYDMEISHNFELGARFRSDNFEVMPSLFYSTHDNLLTTVYDPRVNLSYQQNVGEATGYGVEIETNFFIGSDLTLFFNPTYTSMTYDSDLTYQGTTFHSKDNQVVDTPEWMVKTGLIYRKGPFEIIPVIRYLGDRYGDIEHTEEIDDFITADLALKYSRKMASMNNTMMKVALQFQNIFDEEYIASVNASDDSRAGSTSYYVGAPFTTMLSVSFEY